MTWTDIPRLIRATALPIVLLSVQGCDRYQDGATSVLPENGAARAVASVVVDSALPMSELLDRFQASAGDRPRSLVGGESSIEPLVQRYLMALAANDTSMLRALSVSPAEYAYLVFPGSAMARPPYELDPEIAWMMLALESEKGVQRALSFMEARRVTYAGLRCPEPTSDGAARISRGCVVSVQLADGSTAPVMLFGEIVELRGQYKFLSYANRLSSRLAFD